MDAWRSQAVRERRQVGPVVLSFDPSVVRTIQDVLRDSVSGKEPRAADIYGSIHLMDSVLAHEIRKRLDAKQQRLFDRLRRVRVIPPKRGRMSWEKFANAIGVSRNQFRQMDAGQYGSSLTEIVVQVVRQRGLDK